jgi:hypothetical protein
MIEFISCSVYLNICQLVSEFKDYTYIVSIDSVQSHPTIVHLSGEDFITKEVVSKKAAILIWRVDAIMSCHIWKISNHSMEGIILFFNIIKMFSMPIDSILTENSLKKKETVIIFVLPRRSIVKHTNIAIYHFIISNK